MNDKLESLLKKNRPVPKEARAGEAERIWNAIESNPTPARLRTRLFYPIPAAAAAMLVVFFLVKPTVPKMDDLDSSEIAMGQSLTLSFDDEDEGLDGFELLMAD